MAKWQSNGLSFFPVHILNELGTICIACVHGYSWIQYLFQVFERNLHSKHFEKHLRALLNGYMKKIAVIALSTSGKRNKNLYTFYIYIQQYYVVIIAMVFYFIVGKSNVSYPLSHEKKIDGFIIIQVNKWLLSI